MVTFALGWGVGWGEVILRLRAQAGFCRFAYRGRDVA